MVKATRKLEAPNQKEPIMETSTAITARQPWNKGKLVGQKTPLKLKEIWAIRIRLHIASRCRDLALEAAPVRWTVYRLRFVISSPSILHPKRSLPPQAAEALGGFFSSVRRKLTAYKAPGAEISPDPWRWYLRKSHAATVLHS
jgi:hypothetical protein